MTMTSSERGLPFPLKRGEVRPASLEGTSSAEKSIERGTGGDRESLSIDAVRDYSVEVRFCILFIPPHLLSAPDSILGKRNLRVKSAQHLLTPTLPHYLYLYLFYHLERKQG